MRWNFLKRMQGTASRSVTSRSARSRCRRTRLGLGCRPLACEPLEARRLLSAFPTPLPLAPLGSLIYETSVDATISSTETDTFTIDLDHPQTITVVVDPVPGLKPTVTLSDPNHQIDESETPDSAGDNVVIQAIAATGVTTYTVTVSGASSTTGDYSCRLILNAAVEMEEYDTSTNDDTASAEDLDPYFVALGDGSAGRVAVLGAMPLNLGTLVDHEGFDIETGYVGAPVYPQWAGVGGDIYVTGGHGAAEGRYALLMGNDNNNEVNHPTWTVNLSGLTAATLSFYHAEWNDAEDHFPGSGDGDDFLENVADDVHADGVAISDDGNEWHPIWNAPDQPAGEWQLKTIDLAAKATAHGLTMVSDFQIRFYESGDHPVPSNGRGYDDIVIIDGDPDPRTEEDWYSFTLNEGQSATLALMTPTTDYVNLELYDNSGTPVLLDSGVRVQNFDKTNVDKVIHNFVAPATDTYYVCVADTDAALDYRLVVTRDADFDTESNNDLGDAQDITLSGTASGYLGSDIPRVFNYGAIDWMPEVTSQILENSVTEERLPNAFDPPWDPEDWPGVPDPGMAITPTSLLITDSLAIGIEPNVTYRTIIREIDQDTGDVIRTMDDNGFGDIDEDGIGDAVTTSAAYMNHEIFLFSKDTDGGDLNYQGIQVVDYDTGLYARHIDWELEDKLARPVSLREGLAAWPNASRLLGIVTYDDNDVPALDAHTDLYAINPYATGAEPTIKYIATLTTADIEGAASLGGMGVIGNKLYICDEPGNTTDRLDVFDLTPLLPLVAADATVVDDGDYDNTLTGTWGGRAGGYEDDMHYSYGGDGSDTATWKFQVAGVTKVRVFATWVEDEEDGAPNAPYTITFGGGTWVDTADHSATPGDEEFTAWGGLEWEELVDPVKGPIVGANATLTVTLSDDVNDNQKLVIADAIRVEHWLGVVREAGSDNVDDGSMLATTAGGGEGDTYSFDVNLDDEFEIRTHTPAGGANQFANLLDPAIELYDPSGALVGLDYDSAADVRNAVLTHTAEAAGTYTVRVLGENDVTIIDDGDSLFDITGTWSTTSSAGAGYQSDRTSHASGAGSDTATWTFSSLATDHAYKVSATWKESGSNAAAATYQIFDGSSTWSVLKNQQLAPDDFTDVGFDWEMLDTIFYHNGTLTVKLSQNLSGGDVVADAIRIEDLGPVRALIDDGDSTPKFTTSGTWTLDENRGYGDDLRTAAASEPLATATWTFDVTPGYRYEVSTTWEVDASDPADEAAYTLTDGLNERTVLIDQTTSPSEGFFHYPDANWTVIDEITCTTDTLVVTLSSYATGDEVVVADAVRIEPLSIGGSTGEYVLEVKRSLGIIDDGDADFAVTPDIAWSTTSGPGEGYQNDRRSHASGTGSDTATWTFDVTPGYMYQVSATWKEHASNAPLAMFRLKDGDDDGEDTGDNYWFKWLNQTNAPDDFSDAGVNWEILTTSSFTTGKLEVTLFENEDGIVVADAIHVELVGPGATFIDDGDPLFSQTGDWTEATGNPIYGFDQDGRYSVGGGDPDTATWTFYVTPGYQYELSATWLQDSNRDTVRYTIRDQDHEWYPWLSQTNAPNEFYDQGEDWRILGTFSMTGSKLEVEVSDFNVAEEKLVIADAMRLIQRGPAAEFIDDEDPGYTEVGNWSDQEDDYQAYEGDVHYKLAGNGSATTEWSFTVEEEWLYEVSITWWADSNRADDVPYLITNGNNTWSGLIDMSVPPDDFKDQGRWWEVLENVGTTNTTLTVELSDDAQAGKYVIADAVRLFKKDLAVEIHDDDDDGVTMVSEDDPTNQTDTYEIVLTKKPTADVIVTLVTSDGETTAVDNATPANGYLTFTTSNWFTPQTVLVTAEDDEDEEGSHTGLITHTATSTDLDYNGISIGSVTVLITDDDVTEQAIDDGDPVFYDQLGSGWIASGSAGYEGDLVGSNAGGGWDTATWTLLVMPGYEYQISASWLAWGNRADNAPYEISVDGIQIDTTTADQQVAPNDVLYDGTWFEILGDDWYNVTGSVLTITLTDLANGIVIADAIHVEQGDPLPPPPFAPAGGHDFGLLARAIVAARADASNGDGEDDELAAADYLFKLIGTDD